MNPGMTLGGTAWSLIGPPWGPGKKQPLMYCETRALIGSLCDTAVNYSTEEPPHKKKSLPPLCYPSHIFDCSMRVGRRRGGGIEGGKRKGEGLDRFSVKD